MTSGTGDAGLARIRLPMGWPEPLPGLTVRASESSIALGLAMTPDVVGSWLPRYRVKAGRIAPDAQSPDPRVVVPEHALTDTDSFREWVFQSIGPTGRMLIWPDDESWWIVEDADWEVTIACGPDGLLDLISPPSDVGDFLSWLGPVERLTTAARDEAARVSALYGFTDT